MIGPNVGPIFKVHFWLWSKYQKKLTAKVRKTHWQDASWDGSWSLIITHGISHYYTVQSKLSTIRSGSSRSAKNCTLIFRKTGKSSRGMNLFSHLWAQLEFPRDLSYSIFCPAANYVTGRDAFLKGKTSCDVSRLTIFFRSSRCFQVVHEEASFRLLSPSIWHTCLRLIMSLGLHWLLLSIPTNLLERQNEYF